MDIPTGQPGCGCHITPVPPPLRMWMSHGGVVLPSFSGSLVHCLPPAVLCLEVRWELWVGHPRKPGSLGRSPQWTCAPVPAGSQPGWQPGCLRGNAAQLRPGGVWEEAGCQKGKSPGVDGFSHRTDVPRRQELLLSPPSLLQAWFSLSTRILYLHLWNKTKCFVTIFYKLHISLSLKGLFLFNTTIC
jgi:hypothetical protein